jgi:hypothetical protein
MCSAVAQSPFDLIRIFFARLTRHMQFADVLTFDQIARLDDIHQFGNEQNARLTHLLKGANEHSRPGGYCSGSKKERQLTASTWQMMCSAAVAAGLTSFSVETYSYKVPAGRQSRTISALRAQPVTVAPKVRSYL